MQQNGNQLKGNLNTAMMVIVLFSDKCTALPDSFSFGLKANDSLPANYGTRLEVDCISGYSLSGSRLITCIKDKSWDYEETPDCILGKFEGLSAKCK